MKVLKGLYATICYIVAIPFMMVMLIVMLLMNIKHPVLTLEAAIGGFKMSHNKTVEFIKYG